MASPITSITALFKRLTGRGAPAPAPEPEPTPAPAPKRAKPESVA
jgi:hypothetical protein